MDSNLPEAVEIWRTDLGLLPVPLLATTQSRGAYVLLNGTRGSFCLEIAPSPSASVDRRSEAWSANVGHFVTISGNEVIVERWDQQPGISQRFQLSEVQKNLAPFHAKLERFNPSADFSVIAHALRVFRSLRAALEPSIDGSQALQSFLYLIAATADREERGQVDLEAWGLDSFNLNLALTIPEHTWRDLRSELAHGLKLHALKPDFRILLRHASGPLFQEAHYLAQFPFRNQPMLPELGIVPKPVTVIPKTNTVGLHFTPPTLVRTIVEESLAEFSGRSSEIFIFDPACGSGEFLREAIRQLRLGGFRESITVTGWDASEAACAMARFSLSWETRNSTNVQYEIHKCDALDENWPRANLILMNPPFLSVKNLSNAQKDQIRNILGEHARGRYDMSSAFIWKSATSLHDGGVLATVLPASFLEGESFAPIRGALARRLKPRLIARLGSQEIFQQATVDSGIYIATREQTTAIATAVWADHRLSSSYAALRELRRMRLAKNKAKVVVRDGFSIFPNQEIGIDDSGWAPRPFRQWRLWRRATKLPRVTDCFTVRQGALTGLNRAFLVSDDHWNDLPATERPFFRPAVLNESIAAGRVRRVAHVFYPCGDYQITSELQLRKLVPRFFSEHLEPYKKPLKQRKLSKDTNWWELTRHRSWQEKPILKLVSTYFGKKGSFAWDEGGDYVVVQGYAWLIKGLGGTLSREIWLAYLALINSDLFEALLSATSDNVGGGQWNLSIRYVRHLPIPKLDPEAALTQQLARLGQVIHLNGLDKLDQGASRELHKLCETAFGVKFSLDAG